jgi:hypothetical protein
MRAASFDADEIAAAGEQLYEKRIRRKLKTNQRGKFCAIAIPSGEFEVADEMINAIQQLEKRSDEPSYIKRIGYRTAVRIGGSSFRIKS